MTAISYSALCERSLQRLKPAWGTPTPYTNGAGHLRRNWHKLVAVLFHGGTNYSQHAVSIIETLASQQHYPPTESHDEDQREACQQSQQSQQQQQQQDGSRYPGSSGVGAPLPPPPSSSATATAATATAATQTATEQQSTSASTASFGREAAGGKRDDGCSVLFAEANVMSLIDVSVCSVGALLPFPKMVTRVPLRLHVSQVQPFVSARKKFETLRAISVGMRIVRAGQLPCMALSNPDGRRCLATRDVFVSPVAMISMSNAFPNGSFFRVFVACG